VTAITASFNVNGTAPMLANLNMNNYLINNVGTPLVITDGANKGYVDGASTNEVTVSLASGSVTLTAAQAAARYIILTGALTANVTVTFPTAPINFCYINNQTTGAYNVTLANAGAGTSVTLPQPSALPIAGFINPLPIFHDATNITNLHSDPLIQPQVGFRNRIINGSFAVDQRYGGGNKTFTAGAALSYCVDRWWGACTGANIVGSQNLGVNPDFTQYDFTGATGVTGVSLGQRIEAGNCWDLAGGYACLSVRLANTLLTTVTWTAYYANTTNTFGTLASPTKTQIATGTFTVNGALTTYQATFAVPAAATTGIEIVFSVGAQTSGSWAISEAQLEPVAYANSFATPFERRPYGLEYLLCLRYYETQVAPFTCYFGAYGAGAYGGQTGLYQVQKRTTPTFTPGTLVTSNCAAPTLGTNNASGFVYNTTATALGNASYYFSTLWTSSAEL
jgi:hypothetical protein